jgi:N-acetylglucosaminyldiphosphoundecaprenol N-acetyl-beta-D-mannosaminyltransferase
MTSASTPIPKGVEILGVTIHDVTHREALATLEGFIRSGRPHQVVTPNPEIVMLAARDTRYRALLNASDLAIPDGIGLLLASRMRGTPLRQHVRGTDLVLSLAARSVSAGWRWFLLGAQEGVAAEAAIHLQRQFPGLQIVGAAPGSPYPVDDATTRELIRAVEPVHVLLVAYGAPRQEQWIARNQEAVGVPVQIGVGGVLDFFSGRARRAPALVRRLELEWAFRLAMEPWRWKRQLALPVFGALAAMDAIQHRCGAWRLLRRGKQG